MRIKMSVTIIFILVLMCLSAFGVTAAPACPEPFEYLQPDGSTVELYAYGDESYNFTGDKDGYLMKMQSDGTYTYVTDETSPVFLSPSVDGSRPANAIKGFDLRDKYAVDFGVDASIEGNGDLPHLTSLMSTSSDADVYNLLIIAVDFNDVQIDDTVWTKDLYNRRFFSSEHFSVAKYYDEVSGGRASFVPAFTMTDSELSSGASYGKICDGVIKVKVNTNHNNDGTVDNIATLSRPMIANIMPMADTYIDFSVYDKDRDGSITNDELAICFITAGYEASLQNSVTTQEMWGHKWYLNYDMYCDNVKLMYNPVVSGYVMIGANMARENIPSSVGIFCHELGHLVFGFPDLYASSGTDYSDIGYASLMNKGNWGMSDSNVLNGSHPTHLDPWCIIQMGWLDDGDLIEATEKTMGVYDIVSSLSGLDGPRYIRIRPSADSDEYFIIENRQYEGFDIGLRYHITTPGIAVWRVDESKITADSYLDNTMNVGTQPAIKLIHSGKGLPDFYNSKKPFWRKGINSMGFLGNTSFPASKLNTFESSDQSDVKIDFLSGPSKKMTVKLGGSDVNTMLYVHNGYAEVTMFNNTDTAVTTYPILAEYSENAVTDIKKFNSIEIDANGYKSTNPLITTIKDDKTYKIFNMSPSGLIPIAPRYDVVK